MIEPGGRLIEEDELRLVQAWAWVSIARGCLSASLSPTLVINAPS
jgi:hypothetical protein